MKKILLVIITLSLLITPITSFAAQPTNDFEIIPESSDQATVDKAVSDV